MDAATADAIAAQSREILRSVKVQLNVLAFAKQGATNDLIRFASTDER
jgi:hypothetical protein